MSSSSRTVASVRSSKRRLASLQAEALAIGLDPTNAVVMLSFAINKLVIAERKAVGGFWRGFKENSPPAKGASR